MKFFSVATALLLAGTCRAWTQAAKGAWIASNNIHKIGDRKEIGSSPAKSPFLLLYFIYSNAKRWCTFAEMVHEACTTMNMENVHSLGSSCVYWLDNEGHTIDGSMKPPILQFHLKPIWMYVDRFEFGTSIRCRCSRCPGRGKICPL